MKKSLSVIFSLCLLSLYTAFAQVEVRGKIVDEAGLPVIGVAVVVEGTTTGTETDLDGNWRLIVPSSNSMLILSFIGFETVRIPASQASRVVLKEDALFLQEVLVIGYGQVKKSDATGSVLAIKADPLNRVQAVTASDLLLGRSAGVQVTAATGQPGSPSTIRIRGGSSLSASNDPLIVIDGVPIANDGVSGMNNPMALINPNDIETYTVLKDASATAIYGARASNGVIIITTKKGAYTASKGVNVNYSGNIGVSTAAKTVDVLNAEEFRKYIIGYYGADSNAAAALGSANTDWQREIYRVAKTTDHSISLSGGILNIPYRISGGYTYQEGILIGTGMNRYTANVNLNPSFFDDHLTISLNGKMIHYENQFRDAGAIGGAVQYDPTQPVYWDKANQGLHGGLYGYHTWIGLDNNPNTMAGTNPVALANQIHDRSNVNWYVGNAQFDYKFHFLPSLRVNLNLAFDGSYARGNKLIPNRSDASYHQYDKDGKGVHTRYTQDKINKLLELYGAYTETFKDHKIDLMAGYSWQHFYKTGTNLEAFTDGSGGIRNKTEYKTENFLVSFFGRANYIFKDRYMLTATLRYDGSSRFADHWGLFPSAAFAWRINNEGFMKNASSISDLKLRLSYGVTGQQDLIDNNYPYLAAYTSSYDNARYPFGDEYITTLRPGGYDVSLKWEETTTYNAGIDFGFLRDRIYGSIDGYFRETKDLINYIPVAAGTNLTNYLTTNVGNLENKGLEFSINAKPVVTNDITWDVGFNFTWSDTKITKLTTSDDPAYKGVSVGGISGGVDNKVQMHSVGFAPNTFYLYEQVYDKNGNPMEGYYVDQNNDGIINSDDLVLNQDPAPDYYMGFNTTLKIKDFDFSFSMRANIGNYIYNNVLSDNSGSSLIYVNNFLRNILREASVIGFDNAQYLSDHYLENASFLRVDNITAGYNFSFRKAGSMRIYLTAQNPFVFTKYKGIDPEMGGGIDNNIYPRPLNIVFGVNYNF